jgi:site-specific recombinase XerD
MAYKMAYMDNYLTEMKKTKSESTVKNHKATLNKFFKLAQALQPVEVLPEDIMKFKKAVLQTGTTASMNTQLKRIKAFFKWCVEMNILDMSPADDVKLVSEAEAVPKWFSPEQKGALLRAIKRDHLGDAVAVHKKSYRELLMVMLMMKAGLRVGELVNLKHSDCTLTDRKGVLIIRGKNDQQRTVPVTSDTLKVFKQYLEHHGTKGAYVFFSRQSDKVTEKTVQNILKKYEGLKTDTAELTEVTPHMLRHTYAHDLAKGGLAIESIARLMGHIKKNGQPNIQQTIRYTMSSMQEIQDEVEDILAIN